jgi:hypothetical protein
MMGEVMARPLAGGSTNPANNTAMDFKAVWVIKGPRNRPAALDFKTQ